MKTIAILGYPGAGKSWAVYEFLKWMGVPVPNSITDKIGLVEYHDLGPVVVIGKYDGSKFQGTDRLSMAVAPDFTKFYQKMKDRKLIIAEGDRINNMTFFKAAMAHGTLERIKCNPESYMTLLKQRADRGHTFAQSFLKTIISKVDKHNFDKMLDSASLYKYLKTQIV